MKTEAAKGKSCKYCCSPMTRRERTAGRKEESHFNFRKRQFCSRSCCAKWLRAKINKKKIPDDPREECKIVKFCVRGTFAAGSYREWEEVA